ncbi:uncharacterized protein LOC124225762 isoform X2 [Equus quagga]|uniref:uncharacterized protein LOC124225762 isoform X2 n=1 Tax=Equus quagga TaxID=89248 RepID=UPI001EE1AD88|nr:uncharacterized protein LOC124225762 isoform X2 [Equus quagga]
MLRPVGECRAEREADESEVPVPDVEQMLQAALDFLLTDLTTPGLAVRLRPLAPFRAHRKPKNFLLCVQFSVTSLFTLLCCDHHRHPSPELFSFSQTETLFSPNNGSPFPFLQPLATPFLLSDSESDYSRCPILETHNGNGLVLLCQHQYRRSHKFLTNPTMSEPHGALETSQATRRSPGAPLTFCLEISFARSSNSFSTFSIFHFATEGSVAKISLTVCDGLNACVDAPPSG